MANPQISESNWIPNSAEKYDDEWESFFSTNLGVSLGQEVTASEPAQPSAPPPAVKVPYGGRKSKEKIYNKSMYGGAKAVMFPQEEARAILAKGQAEREERYRSYVNSAYVPTTSAECEPDPEMNITTITIDKIIKFTPIDPRHYPRVKEAHSAMVNVMTHWGAKLPIITDFPTVRKEPEALVGVELEIEGIAVSGIPTELQSNQAQSGVVASFQKVWHVTDDTSLRNHGKEFVSLVGVTAGQMPHALDLFRLYADTFYKHRDLSYRCGTHVHIDVRKFTVEQYINMLTLYILFEDMYYEMAGEGRKENQFCVPVRDSNAGVEAVYELVHKPRPTYNDFRRCFRSFSKYMAYNMLPTGDMGSEHRPKLPIGTVEFRHHEGCSDMERLCKWIQAIVDIHFAAQQYSFIDLSKRIFALNTKSDYLQFAQEIFTDLPVRGNSLRKGMYEGCRTIKELYLTAKGNV